MDPRSSGLRPGLRAWIWRLPSLGVGLWLISEVPPAAFGWPHTTPNRTPQGSQAAFKFWPLCSRLHPPNLLQNSPKIGLRRLAHGSISIQEGQPVIKYLIMPATPQARSNGNCHRQTEILLSGASRNWLLWIARARTARQQSSGEFSSAASTTRTKDARFQINQVGSAFSVHAAVYNTFNVQRHLIRRPTHRQFRTVAHNSWSDATAAVA
jgi:hypothetical protein